MTAFDTLAATRELATKTDIGWIKAYLGFIAALSFATLGLTAAHVFGAA